ncbi:MAG: integrase arm-type DNA-binding domain-containing protein [Pseudomonadota bacterium]
MLTDRQCRTAKPGEKEIKLFDQHGLYLAIRPTGHKSWKMKLRVGGKEKKLTFGPYPEVTLAKARERMFETREQLRRGEDPTKPPNPVLLITFEQAARRWLSLQAEGWKPKYLAEVTGRIESDLLPQLGELQLDSVTPRDLVNVLEEVQMRGAIEVAHRLRGYASNIYDMAIVLDWVQTNPAASIAKALKPVRKRKYPALLRIQDCRQLIRLVDVRPGQPVVKLASRLLALTAVRPGNIRWAQRDEFEGIGTSEPLWRIPASKMKLELSEAEDASFEFVVPLSKQAVEVLEVAIELSGQRKYLFASTRQSHQPISDSALSSCYSNIPEYSGRHVPHGWRSSFSTIMNQLAADESRQGEREIIDLMLAHRPVGVEPTYNRAAYMPQRRRIAQAWGDLLCVDLAPPRQLLHGLRKRQPTR